LTRELLDNQQLSSNQDMSDVSPVQVSLGRVVSIFLGMALVILTWLGIIYYVEHADPYIRNVLALEGHSDRGQEIFVMNCATCHGLLGKGEVGPSLQHVSSRKSDVGLIHQVVSGDTPPMPQFQPSEQDMADLLQFLEQL
jgi:mono/diheme cytochrome c family protein